MFYNTQPGVVISAPASAKCMFWSQQPQHAAVHVNIHTQYNFKSWLTCLVLQCAPFQEQLDKFKVAFIIPVRTNAARRNICFALPPMDLPLCCLKGTSEMECN